MMNELSTERAIEALYTVRAYYASLTAGYPKGKDCRGIGDVMCSEIANSCLMAIKALEQQPCEDCISRQAVNDMLSEEWTKYMPMELDINLSFVMEKINELPSVIPKTRWIPVSESLPDNRGYYLTTVKIEIHDLNKLYYEIRAAQFDGKDFDVGYIGDGFSVVAWMPPLQPYKAESEDSE